MKSQENIDLEVTQDGLRFAGIYSLKINDANERKRAFASLVILSSIANFFMKQGLSVSGTKSLYKASKLSEEFEITDLYVNNWRLDIRLAMPGDYFYIPKSHYENEILPDYYIVATIDKDLKKPEFIGYVSPKELKTTTYNSLYYRANFDDLGEMSVLLQKLKQEKNYYCKEKDHRFFHTKILTYFDNDADNYTKTKLLNHLLNCQSCRTELINFCGFDIIAKKLENYVDLFDDDSLNIIGALNAQDDYDEDEEEEGENRQEEVQTQEKTEQGELIDGLFDNIPKPSKPMDTKPFKNISEDQIEVLPSTNKERITLTEPDIFLQDIPPLRENDIQPKTQIKLNKLSQETSSPLTFTEDSPEPTKRISLADSLQDIPDEIFTSGYEEETPKKSRSKQNNSSNDPQTHGEKIIVDYDEFGQPIYEESSPEDYQIVEETPVDSFKKRENSPADITDSFTKDEEKEEVIEGSSETCNDELISNAPPQTKKKRKRNSFIPVILGLFALFLLTYFLVVNPIFKNSQKEADIPSLNPNGTYNENNINDIISKNINSKTGLVKIKKINWVAQKSLLQDDGFKDYLQTIDKRFRVKFKLNSNSFTQAPFNNNVVAEIIVTPDGEIKSSRMASSSGIKDLDKAIMDSIKEATDMLPIPAKTQANMQLSEYYIKIMIKL